MLLPEYTVNKARIRSNAERKKSLGDKIRYVRMLAALQLTAPVACWIQQSFSVLNLNYLDICFHPFR